MLKKLLKKELFCASDQVILQSGKRLVMENCKKVFYCDPERIVLEGKVRLEILGSGLTLYELGNDNMEVRGVIHSIILGEDQ